MEKGGKRERIQQLIMETGDCFLDRTEAMGSKISRITKRLRTGLL